MSTIQEIKLAIERLDDSSLGKLSNWLENYLAEKWENHFTADVKAGRLDEAGAIADRAFKRGEVRPL